MDNFELGGVAWMYSVFYFFFIQELYIIEKKNRESWKNIIKKKGTDFCNHQSLTRKAHV